MSSIALGWYLFLKPYDYIIKFETNANPGVVEQSIKVRGYGNTNLTILNTNDDNHSILETLRFGDSVHIYNWRIIKKSKTLTQVTVGIKDQNWLRSIMNKLKVPFVSTDFVKSSEKNVLNFMKNLKNHLKDFKITIVGVTDIPEKTLAYIQVRKNQFNKAFGMMENSNFINEELYKNKLELDGPPMLEVIKWDKSNDSLIYNFGSPIKTNQKLPSLNEIKYKKIPSRKALKAIFNGNYINSDRTWYALLEYASENDLQVEELPIEIFYNNPNMGGDPLNWKAEIYMPLKKY